MFQFYFPLAILLLPLPLLFWKSKTKEALLEMRFPHIERLKEAFLGFKQNTSHNRLFYYSLFLIWFFLILALMQPEKVNSHTEVKNKGYDLMLAVDISASMQALDFSTKKKTISRLDAVKEVVSQFALDRQGDRLGLITFGQSAFLHVPLTLDTLSLSQSLKDALPGMAGQSTAIGDAIGVAVQTLKTRPENSRVLILLTDGEDNSSSIPPLEAAKLAKQYGIKIYTVGLGSSGPVPFPNGRGGYGMAEVPIDEKLLKEIAAITSGDYFLAQDQNTLKNIYQKIHELEKSEANMKIHLVRDPLYRIPLSIAMSLLLLLTLYPLIRWRAPYE